MSRPSTAALVAAVASAAMLALPVWGATLRGTVTLQDPSVRLSDLFDSVDADRVIGPAPEPGGRIVVEAAQLAAIARQFNIDWRPAGSGERSVIERPGVAFPRAEAMAALQTALAVAGVPADADIEMPVYLPPMVPPDGSAAPEVSQVDYEPISGRFTALLSVTANGMNPAHARLSGRVQTMVELPVAARRIMVGDVVAPGDIRVARVRAAGVRANVVQWPAQAVGMALLHAVSAGSPLPMADLGRPVLVHKNSLVAMQLDTPGLSLSAQGVAAEDGALSERIRVINPASRAVVTAEVMGPGRVRVEAGQPTILAPGANVPSRLAAR